MSFDPRQALFFPEKRPFFLDGIEYFATPKNLVYTRRIVQPVAAAKLTGKVSGFSLGLLNAVDGTAGSRRRREPSRVHHRARAARHRRARRSSASTFTDRMEGARYNRVASLDGRCVFGGDLQRAGAVRAELHAAHAGERRARARRSGTRCSAGTASRSSSATRSTRSTSASARRAASSAGAGSRRALLDQWYTYYLQARPLPRVDHLRPDVLCTRGRTARSCTRATRSRRSSTTASPSRRGRLERRRDGDDRDVRLRPGAVRGLSRAARAGRHRRVHRLAAHRQPRLRLLAEHAAVEAPLGVGVLPLGERRELLRVGAGGHHLRQLRRRGPPHRPPARRRAATSSSASSGRPTTRRCADVRIPRLKLEYQIARPLFVRLVGEYAS